MYIIGIKYSEVLRTTADNIVAVANVIHVKKNFLLIKRLPSLMPISA
jgi:hypothetical protein